MDVPKKVLEKISALPHEVSELHAGENISWKVSTPKETFVLKRLRTDRTSEYSASGEFAWLSALQDKVPSVRVHQKFSDGEFEYLTYEFIDGKKPDSDDIESFRTAGSLLKQLHDAGAEIIETHRNNPNWHGHQRPDYNLKLVIQNSLESALDSGLLTGESEKFLKKAKDQLISNLPKERTFIHGDFHMGNLVATKDSFKIIDFDECGSGSISYDLGTMRMHTKAMKKEDGWNAFLESYQFEGSEDDLKYGIASRIVFMTGKIPQRLDVPGLADRASSVMERYVGWLIEVLEG